MRRRPLLAQIHVLFPSNRVSRPLKLAIDAKFGSGSCAAAPQCEGLARLLLCCWSAQPHVAKNQATMRFFTVSFRSLNRLARASAAMALAAAVLGGPQAFAAPVTITTPFINFENRAINSLGFGAGQFLRFGGNSVFPNGLSGTTGVALLGGTMFQTNINFDPSPVGPNFFSRYLSVTPQRLGGGATSNPWTLTFSNSVNPVNSALAVVQMLPRQPGRLPLVLAGHTHAQRAFATGPTLTGITQTARQTRQWVQTAC